MVRAQHKEERRGSRSLWERVRVRGCSARAGSATTDIPSPRLSRRERGRAAGLPRASRAYGGAKSQKAGTRHNTSLAYTHLWEIA